MNKDEALKMAIEALQNNQTYDWKGNPLTALDEANEKIINACKKALEQPAQEPVGYWYIMPNGNVYQAKVGEEVPSDYIKIREPNPAQPLSDDEINKLLSKFVECLGTSHGIQENGIPEDNAVKFIRAIEQAHGIGVKDETPSQTD